MKKLKRILALTGVIVLVLMYASTLLFAFIDHSATMGLFKASVVCTLTVPVLLYGIILFYKLSHKDSDDEE